MKIIGLTGGIGSGKSTIAKLFQELGVPVYIADVEAKKLMLTDKLREKIVELLGPKSYTEEELNREYISSLVFKDKSLLEKLNGIVHPAVKNHFLDWAKTHQHSPYVIKEAAILFENGGYKSCDETILVTAPERIRINRVMARDKVSEKEVRRRINNQWTDEKKIKLADHVIENIDLEKTKKEVRKIHVKVLGRPINS